MRPLTGLAPRSDRADDWSGKSKLPGQYSPSGCAPTKISATLLVADPARDTREMMLAGLTSSGLGRVLTADSIAAVDELIADGMAGHLALVSLGFGEASSGLIHRLRRGAWQRVIALAPTIDPEPMLRALQAGASGVLRGHPRTPAVELPRLLHELTEREIEVLHHVADGRSNKWIADQMALSALTIKSHLARISRKLGTGDRAHMVAIAMRAGLVR